MKKKDLMSCHALRQNRARSLTTGRQPGQKRIAGGGVEVRMKKNKDEKETKTQSAVTSRALRRSMRGLSLSSSASSGSAFEGGGSLVVSGSV